MDNWVELERQFCKSWEKPMDTFHMASLFDISREDAVACRIRYLRKDIRLYNKYKSPITIWWKGEAQVEIEKLQLRLAELAEENNTNEITNSMISYARNVDITKVVDFSRGKALAFCHMDKNPSLNHYKEKNRAHCFTCGKSFDTIAVLMERDGFTFPEAVRYLNAC